jgi:asparagine synthase (glutamine-hydrolysing)
MFAFAIWDPRVGRLSLVRDRLGIKPLYLARTRDGLLFASELRALLASGALERRIDPQALQSYVWNGFVVGPRTIATQAELLPAGSLAEFDDAGRLLRSLRYWDLPEPDPSGDPDAATGALGEALERAVEERLVADVPLGIFLSGGIDSSAVAALAVRRRGRGVRTFNVSFPEEGYDESGHAWAVARALETEHTEVPLDAASFRARLDDALRSLDQPTFDAINTYFVSRAVREAGLTVALAGTGGDEVFGGYSSFRDLPRARRWARALGVLPGAASAALAGVVLRALAGRSGAVPPQTRWGKLADVLATRGDLVALYQCSYALFTRSFLRELLPGGGDDAVLDGLPRERARSYRSRFGARADLAAISDLELRQFLGERLLRDTDVASMATSLEVRVPLVDRRVLEAAARVPEARRFRPVGQKQLLRELALGGVSPESFDRPKAGFELPLAVWCRRELRTRVADLLTDAGSCRSLGLDPDRVARLWQAFDSGAPGHYWSRIWALYVLLWWCREHRFEL